VSLALAALSTSLVLAACSVEVVTTVPPKPDPMPPVIPSCGAKTPAVADEACACYASTYCAAIDTCTPFAIVSFYGTRDDCVPRETLGCQAALAAPGATAGPADRNTCSTALESMSCTDVVLDDIPVACRPKGSRPDGAPCGNDWQCAGGKCD